MRTLGSIVDEYIIAAGYDTRHGYDRLYNIAVAGLKDLWYDVSGIPAVVNLPTDNLNRAEIPQGLVKIISLSFQSERGLIPIYPSSSKNPIIDDCPPVNDTQDFLWDTASFPFRPEAALRYRNGEFLGGIYSGGNGNPFVYRVNYETNTIEFSSNIPTKLIVAEYLCNPSVIDGKFMVDEFVADALVFYIDWMDSAFKKSVPPFVKREKEQLYHRRKSIARARVQSENIRILGSGFRKGYKLTPS
jgi:hypothetical protein